MENGSRGRNLTGKRVLASLSATRSGVETPGDLPIASVSSNKAVRDAIATLMQLIFGTTIRLLTRTMTEPMVSPSHHTIGLDVKLVLKAFASTNSFATSGMNGSSLFRR